MPITPAQSRAGRGLVSMTQQELADASGVSLRTITNFEKGERTPIPANLAALRTALEKAGVEFIDENGSGPGVRLRKRSGNAAAPQDGREVVELADAAGKPGPALVRSRQRRKA